MAWIDKEFWAKVNQGWSSTIVSDTKKKKIKSEVKSQVRERRKNRNRMKSAIDFLRDDSEDI